MLGGIAPILIISIKKNIDTTQGFLSKIPLVSKLGSQVPLPPIPIYLDENLTGLYVQTQEKSVDVETKSDGSTDGSDPKNNQTPVGSVVSVELNGLRDSIGLTLLNAVIDLIVPRLVSKEYSITYLNGSQTVFDGLLHSYKVSEISGSTKSTIMLELVKTTDKTAQKPGPPEVAPVAEPVSLDAGGAGPTATVRGGMKGPSAAAGAAKKATQQKLPIQPDIVMGGVNR